METIQKWVLFMLFLSIQVSFFMLLALSYPLLLSLVSRPSWVSQRPLLTTVSRGHS
jgi:hypothetical protein